jgi:hypothetical protein
MQIKMLVSEICTAFNEAAIGSRVLAERFHDFLEILTNTIGEHKFPESGQAKILLPAVTNEMVSCGVAKRANLTANDFVAREYRGKVSLFAKREFAAKTESIFAIVYTVEAYLKDPDLTPQEAARMAMKQYTHVLVALLAHAGPKDVPYGSRVLVHNIAGGNNEFIPKTKPGDLEKGVDLTLVGHDLRMLHRWIELAKASEQYELDWAKVAD